VTADADLLVAGGGPVGLAVAIHARLRGLTVLLAEPREGPIDKACGEGLMPGALAELALLGAEPPGWALHGVSYLDGRRRADHLFGGSPGRGVRRTTLSAALIARAESLGVVRIPARVEGIRQDGESVVAAGVSARYLVGADGLHSTVRRLAGLERSRGRGRRYGLRRHFRVAPWSHLIEVHWSAGLEAYVTPVADDTVGVALLGRQGTGFDEAIAELPALADRLADAPPASALRGAGPFAQRTSRRVAGRVLLAGDASGYVDAITGEGLRVGWAQARALAECLADDDPGRYERRWREGTRSFRLLTGGLVVLASSPLRRTIVPLAGALPGVYGGIVERLAR